MLYELNDTNNETKRIKKSNAYVKYLKTFVATPSSYFNAQFNDPLDSSIEIGVCARIDGQNDHPTPLQQEEKSRFSFYDLLNRARETLG